MPRSYLALALLAALAMALAGCAQTEEATGTDATDDLETRDDPRPDVRPGNECVGGGQHVGAGEIDDPNSRAPDKAVRRTADDNATDNTTVC